MPLTKLEKKKLGSRTAKGGFSNEGMICKKFNNWKRDINTQVWLKTMGYDLEKINSVLAIRIPTRIKKDEIEKFNISETEYYDFVRFKKADAQVRIIITIGNIIKIENISLKKANKDANYNQIDKRSVDSYQEMWKFDDEISLWLKLFTGEILPRKYKYLIGKIKLRDKRKVYMDEMPLRIQQKILSFFNENRIIVLTDILKGRGGLSANWILVSRYNRIKKTRSWILKDINTTMNFYGKGDVVLSSKGNLYIGKITMQRKGGTPDPTKLQFKFKPCELFEIEND
ncbi:MAG: type II restriction endonuclease [Ignavibacteria bacterium]|nr:type II restriction endonuclease [Ignavibacteria bacterium]